MARGRKSRGLRFKFMESVRIAKKKDSSGVNRNDSTGGRKMDVQAPRNNGVVFKLKMRKKHG